MNVLTYIRKYNEIAEKLLKSYVAGKKNENIVFSPLSILILLSMAADATCGITEKEILNVIGPEPDPDTVYDIIKRLQEQLTAEGALSTANAVIVNEKVAHTITEGYANHLKRFFEGELFATSELASDVNAWVKKKTKGMIGEVFDDTAEDIEKILLCLINAVAFETEWMKQYEETDVDYDDFHNFDGSKSRVAMLVSEENEYIENDSFIGFVKPYKKVGYSYMVLLPKENESIAAMIENFKIDFSEIFRKRRHEQVDVKMPEFRCDFSDEVTETCKEMGIRTIFTPEADFSPLSSAWLKASSVVHKAHIEVDRKGTKAAAVTEMIVFGGASEFPSRKWVYVNRPFIYAIIHNITGLPVFVGVTNHIEEVCGKVTLSKGEKIWICESLLTDIQIMIFGEDWERDYPEGSPEREFNRKARNACFTLNIDELKRVKKEVQDYLGIIS